MKSFTFNMITLILLAASICVAQENLSQVKPPRTHLQIAVIQGNLKAVHQHIAAGSNLNEKEPNAGSTPLISAATFGRTAVAEALIKAGADMNLQNNDGSTALITAAFFCRTEIVKLLLHHGADKTLTNKGGATALQSVSVPFGRVRPIYEQIEKALKPLNFVLDYKRIEVTRPKIAEMLR